MAHTIDRRSEGKNSATKQAKYARAWRKKNEANGMCIKCGVEPVGAGKKTCPICVDRAVISQRKTHFRNHLAENGIPKDCLDGYADSLSDLITILSYKPVQNLLEKHGVYPISDYEDTLVKLENALNSAAL